MYEKAFRVIENQEMTLHELALELESIIGHEIDKSEFLYKRNVALKPNTHTDKDVFHVQYNLLNFDDFIDVTVSIEQEKQLKEYDIQHETFTVELISYIKREVEEGK